MKKFLSLFLITLFAMTCFAAESPRWVGTPVYVYIPEYGYMSTLMKQAFQTWQNQSRNLITFKFVPKPSDANIEVEFTDFVSGCNSDNAVGCTELMTKKGQYYKAYITIGTKEYVRDYSNRQYSRKIVTRSKEHIYGVMLHEAGHAIGLGHSGSKGSIMFPYDLEELQYLTDEDLQLLYNKYH